MEYRSLYGTEAILPLPLPNEVDSEKELNELSEIRELSIDELSAKELDLQKFLYACNAVLAPTALLKRPHVNPRFEYEGLPIYLLDT